MSHSYITETFTADKKSTPNSFSSMEGYDEFHSLFLDIAKGLGGFCSVTGNTRHGWAIYTIKNLLENCGFASLDFLTDCGHHFSFDNEYGSQYHISVLNDTQQNQAITELQQLMAMLIDNPNIVYDAEEFGVLSDGEVEQALARDYISSNPAFDPKVECDEGQSADYLCVFLRSILEILKSARAEGRNVIHVLKI